MKTFLLKFVQEHWAVDGNDLNNHLEIDLILCFGNKEELQSGKVFCLLKEQYLNAQIVISSTAGEIYQQTVLENSVIAVAISFTKTAIQANCVNIRDYGNSSEAAAALIGKMEKKDLSYLMVLSDGALVNGSEMVKIFNEAVGSDILITGGLAGDGSLFKSTLVGLNDQPGPGNIVMIGFYGNSLLVTHGSQGGWEMFGLEKTVTKSSGNVLEEIDGINALDLYKKYLGPEARQLPESALLFPLSVTLEGSSTPVVRTILFIDEEKKTMTFAGDVPEGSKVRFMKANLDKVIMAAATAASQTLTINGDRPGFALLVSCVGRKLILGPRTEEEIEAVAEAFGENTILAGFYSYGEISPFDGESRCQLHNQTMTITSFYEIS